MSIIKNPGKGQSNADDYISSNPSLPLFLLGGCPAYHPTPLHDQTRLAALLEIERLWIKDESQRMGLGSFKALGAAYFLAEMAMTACQEGGYMQSGLAGQSFLCASAGNHGLSLAAGARLFGGSATIYLSDTVPEDFAARLRQQGATVVRHGAVYEESMERAQADAAAGKGMLVSDTSWPGYHDIPRRIMEGYLVMGCEVTTELEAIDDTPTHVFLQAGVGGLAAAMARWCRKAYGDAIVIIAVEPEMARPIQASIEQQQIVAAPGGVSNMGRLDCKQPSELAFHALQADLDFAMTISDEAAAATTQLLATHELKSTPSGSAGIAAVHAMSAEDRAVIGLDHSSRVLTVLSEGVS